ncbi:MAG: DUF4349 domain-containing protein [Acholeplasmataceae bacterium]|nr:DUF4349 domain-containing protein [Acholeplasmataceae bacterium]
MKIKKIILGMFFFVFIFFMFGCSSENRGPIDNDDDSGIVNLGNGTSPTRKIIYKAELTIFTNRFDDAVDYVSGLLLSDEWFDNETVSERRATFVLRIKTERLDEVLEDIRSSYPVRDYAKSATDVSLAYQDASDKITALQLQKTRLLELYETASLSDMITINTQLSSIEIEIAKLQGTLNQFDSLVDYSVVEIYIYSSAVASRLPFFNRVGLAFENGFLAVVAILDGIVIALATLLPIAIVFVPSGYGIYRLVKYVNKRKKTKKTV